MWTYAPDLDERTPNILLSGSTNVVPSNKGGFFGVKSWSSSSTSSYPDIADFVCGSAYLLRDDGSDRLFAGTPTKLYEANQTVAYAWTDVSRGGNYAGGKQWMFDMYGGRALAAISVGTLTEIQGSNGAVGTAFSNLTNAPKARIIVVQDNALYAFDYDSGGGEIYDGWIRSDTGSITSWTPGTAECVSGRFTETPGPITAAIKQGNGVVVFKDRGMWRGQYVGLPEVVRWELVTPFVGCLGPLAVVNIDDVIYFADYAGFWRYDGSRPQKLSQDLSSVWRAGMSESANSSNNALTQIGVDDVNNILTIYFKWPSASNTGTDSHFPFNYVTGAWGPECAHSSGQTIGGGGVAVSAVLNGAANKLVATPGVAIAPTTGMDGGNALRWVFNDVVGTLTSRLVNMRLSTYSQSSTVLDKQFKINPTKWEDLHRTRTLTRICLLGTSTVIGAGASNATTYTVAASTYTGTTTVSGTESNRKIDLVANGQLFTLTIVARAQSSSGNTINHAFEWLGFEPEYGSASGKN